MIKRAVDVLDLERLDLIIVENVGNLCAHRLRFGRERQGDDLVGA